MAARANKIEAADEADEKPQVLGRSGAPTFAHEFVSGANPKAAERFARSRRRRLLFGRRRRRPIIRRGRPAVATCDRRLISSRFRARAPPPPPIARRPPLLLERKATDSGSGFAAVGKNLTNCLCVQQTSENWPARSASGARKRIRSHSSSDSHSKFECGQNSRIEAGAARFYLRRRDDEFCWPAPPSTAALNKSELRPLEYYDNYDCCCSCC